MSAGYLTSTRIARWYGGRLLSPHPEHAIDRQIAAIALIHDRNQMGQINSAKLKLIRPGPAGDGLDLM